MTTETKNRVIAAVAGLRVLPVRQPTVLIDLLTAYQNKVQATVATHGGTVVRYAGDALDAVWEHDPRRAADAALRMVALVRDLANEFDCPLEVSVGIADSEFVDARDGAVIKSVSTASAIQGLCRASALSIGISKSLATELAVLYKVVPVKPAAASAGKDVFTLTAIERGSDRLGSLGRP